jgi:hypothetical protein
MLVSQSRLQGLTYQARMLVSQSRLQGLTYQILPVQQVSYGRSQ